MGDAPGWNVIFHARPKDVPSTGTSSYFLTHEVYLVFMLVFMHVEGSSFHKDESFRKSIKENSQREWREAISPLKGEAEIFQ